MAPRVWQLLFSSRRLKSTVMRSFLGDPFRYHSVFSAIWFDSGFLFASAHEVRDSMVQQRWLSRSCISSKVVDFPFVPQRLIPMVLPVWKTTETPQLQYVSWWSLPCCAGRACSARCLLRQMPMVQTLRKFVEVSQSQFLPGCGRRCVYAATSCLDMKMPQIQFIARVSGHFSRDRYAQLQLCMVGMMSAMRGKFAAVLQHFSASVHLDVEAQGGGDAGNLTPRCSATTNLVQLCSGMEKHTIATTRPHRHFSQG